VKINYHIPETNIKKFRLTFNDTNLDTSYNSQVLAPGKDIHNHYYSYPGTYVIKLFYEQKTIDEMVVSVLSDGWKINIQQHNPNPIRKVVHKKMNEHNYLKLSNQDVIKYGLDTNHYFETSFQIVDTFDINADSFMISLDMKNYTEEEEYYCDFNTLIIDTDNGSKIRYRIADPECQRNAKVSVNDLNLEGSKNDLELLTAPIHKWTNITIEARKPDMFFYINNQVVFNTIFRENLGKIRSVFAFFNTTGAIDNVTIYDGNHTAKHVWHFNKK